MLVRWVVNGHLRYGLGAVEETLRINELKLKRFVSAWVVTILESCGLREIRLPEKYKENFDVSSEGPSSKS
jgi:hypothetical protein